MSHTTGAHPIPSHLTARVSVNFVDLPHDLVDGSFIVTGSSSTSVPLKDSHTIVANPVVIATATPGTRIELRTKTQQTFLDLAVTFHDMLDDTHESITAEVRPHLGVVHDTTHYAWAFAGRTELFGENMIIHLEMDQQLIDPLVPLAANVIAPHSATTTPAASTIKFKIKKTRTDHD